jgi:hypothetical protein
MVSLEFVFWLFVGLGALIGMLRGWAKELLVTFSVILAIFIILVLERYVGFIQGLIIQGGPKAEFWTRTAIIILLSFFGYQTPNFKRFSDGARREKLQDSLLGIVLGGFNGYLIIGSIWAYLHRGGYPYAFASPPLAGTVIGDAALRIVSVLPPEYLTIPGIYFAIAVAFTFVVIVFV